MNVPIEVKVLGSGCAKCQKTMELLTKVIADHSLTVTLTKVEDLLEIAGYGVMRTPGVVVDGKVKIVGKVPSEKELIQLLVSPK